MNTAVPAEVAPPPELARAPAAETPWRLMARRFTQHRLAVAALLMLAVLYTLAACAEFFAPYPSEWRNLDYAYCPPQVPAWSWAEGWHVAGRQRHVDPVTFLCQYREDGTQRTRLGFFVRGEPYRLWGIVPMERHFFGVRDRAQAGTFFFLGADKYGQDLFSRLIYGARVSLSVGMIAIWVTFALGVAIGGVSGYLGGSVDNVLQRLIEIVNSFPNLPLWLALGAILPADWSPLMTYFAITLVLSLLNWTSLARVVRGKMLSLREEDYVVAARLLGASHSRILLRHLLPGFTSHIIVVLTLSVPTMILGETALSFLGLGLRPPIVSWGVLLQDCLNVQTVANYPWLLMPVVLIVLTVLSFNFLGDGLRDAADPYSAR